MGRYNQSFRENSSLAIILKVLTESDTQMSVKELTKLVLEKKQLSGKTPDRTISAILQRSQRVVKVSNGKYAINKKILK